MTSRRAFLTAAAGLPVLMTARSGWAARTLRDPAAPPPGYPERILGDPRAPVAMITYFSLTCPGCARFHLQVLPTLIEHHIDTGEACLAMRDYPLDTPAAMGAAVARKAPERQYFALLDALYTEVTAWSQAADVPAALKPLCRPFGVSTWAVDEALQDRGLYQAMRATQKNAEKIYGIRTMPGHRIGEQTVTGTQSVSVFTAAIKAAGG